MKLLWKKGLALVLAGTMAVSLAACGGGSSSSSDSGNSGSGGGETTSASGGGDAQGKLSVAIWDNGQQPGLREIMDEFTANTGIPTELQVITWDSYWTLLEAGASGGAMPDVFWMHSNEAQRYMEGGILLDLTDRIAASETLEMDKFPEDIKSMYVNDGKTYAVPKDIDTIALWYNKTMFDEAGLAYPDDTWTWDTFYDAAVQLTKEDGSQYGTAMNPSNNQDGWYNMVYSMGGAIISDDMTQSEMNSPATVEAIKYVEKLVQNTMPPSTVMSETGTDVLLQSGKIAMLPQGSWMVAPFKANDYLAANCDVAMLPYDAGTGKRVTIYNGLGWAAYEGTANPEGAWQLIEWFGTEAMQKKQAELGVTMAAYEGVSDGWVNNTDLFNLQPYLDMLNEAELVFRPHSRATVVWENMIGTELIEVWSGTRDVETTCQTIADRMNQMLSEE